MRRSASLPLSEPARNALLGEPNPLRSVLNAVMAYEVGSWEEALTSEFVTDELILPRSVQQRAGLGARALRRQSQRVVWSLKVLTTAAAQPTGNGSPKLVEALIAIC